MAVPTKMRAWQYSSNKGGIARNLQLNDNVDVPQPSGPTQLLIRVLSISVNPVDHKPAETILFRFAYQKPSTPGCDFAGEIVKAPADSKFRVGDTVFGTAKNAFAGATLAEYTIAETDRVARLDPISANEGAALPMAGLTAFQSIASRIKPNSRIFINGGSGGTGTLGVQIARNLGHDVTVTCSTRNAELCRSLGAEVIDYTKGNVLQQVKNAASNRKFDLVVDNIYANTELFWKAHEYTIPDAPFVLTPFTAEPSFLSKFLPMKFLPTFLGGGHRKLENFFTAAKLDQLSQMRDWIAEKKMKVVIDQVVPFEKARAAFERTESGRTVGKFIIEVAKSSSTKS